MALQLSRAVSDGFRRTFTRAGGVLFVGLLLIQFGIQTSVNTVVAGFLPAEAAAQFSGETGLVLPVSGSVGLALFGALTLASSAYFVVLSRTFAQPLGEASTFPPALTERLGRATLVALVGGIVVSVAVAVGFVLLFFPGLFLTASFLFFVFVVAVEDGGGVESLKRSWGLARGSRLRLAVVMFLSGAFGLVLGAVTPLVGLVGGPLAADLVTVTLSAAFFVPYYAVIASAYLQLRDGRPSANRTAPEPVDASQTPKL
ncbi:hypothetical protein [Halorubrum yunnanense]|uniref:DUF7847 domain-containing protein n=1 Tax=Halorubrum yunnanense TaxID=1526162 RepID=A0ABD5YH81_9EURY|nr:hypothetical protein [Halorubrum yunnanense]